jgi:hypothetical protein
MRRLINSFTTTLAAILAVTVIAGCSTDNTITLPDGAGGQTSDAPRLPALSTMSLQLDFFGVPTPAVDGQSLAQGKPSDALTQTAAEGNHSNWINAYVRAIYAQLITFDALEEPIAAFALAIHSVPQPQDDGSYLWTYIFVADDGIEYSIFLYGTPRLDVVRWRLEVSTNDPGLALDHFVWFDGETRNDETGGFWQFYKPVDATAGVPVVRMDHLNGTTENRLTVTVNGVGHEDEGDYLDFRETEFTGSIQHYDKSENMLASILWNADGTGSLTVPDYNNGEKACWDERQRDIDCQ